MKKILLFSTLSPYPFWAGSEKYWFDFATDPNVSGSVRFHAVLADSPVTRERGAKLVAAGSQVSFYKHFNVHFFRRNLYRLIDTLSSKKIPTLPWFDHIRTSRPDLVWFCVSTSSQILHVARGANICRELNVPYWLILQQSPEDFFLTEGNDCEIAATIARDAARFVFISRRNRLSFERAIGEVLPNALHSKNTLSAETLAGATKVDPVSPGEPARFFNIGRFSLENKAQHLLIQALAGEEWRSRSWRLTFVGIGGSGEAYLKKMADYFGLGTGRLSFVPFTDSVIEEIGRHDLLLMPSLVEGTPYAMIESMACARPAVGTPVGGIPELIIEGETGWLARTAFVEDVSDALQRAWQAKDHWRHVGRNAREKITAEYTQDQAHGRLLEALREDIR